MTASLLSGISPRVRERYEVVVVDRERVADDVVMVTLRSADPDLRPLPGWGPGDHLDVELTRDLVRRYSLCGTREDPDGRWSFAVRHQLTGTGGSAHVHERLAVGDTLRVVGPKSMFPLEDAARHLLVAGGIGITPLLPMAEQLLAQGRPFDLFYVGRGRGRMPFRDRVAALGPTARLIDREVDEGFGLAGAVADLSSDTLVYACGPAPMLAALRELVPAEQLRTEAFTADAGVVADEVRTEAARDGFEVQLGPGGPVLPVSVGTALLDVMLDAGVDVLWSCREGTCGSCETPLLDGEADHRDQILSAEEQAAQDCLFPCVSRARSQRLVLDVEVPTAG